MIMFQMAICWVLVWRAEGLHSAYYEYQKELMILMKYRFLTRVFLNFYYFKVTNDLNHFAKLLDWAAALIIPSLCFPLPL